MDVGQIILQLVLLLIGFVLLVKGADFFVDGAAGIAKKLKISTFIIGATVVALGTSAPEMAVTVGDAVGGSGQLIVGNILGSNVLNILLILGISALVCKLPVEKTTRVIDIPFLLIISVLFVLFGVFLGSVNTFEWWEGLILLLLYAAFMAYNIVLALKQSKAGLEQAAAVSVGEEAIAVSDEGFFEKIKRVYGQYLNKVWFLIVITLVGLGMVVGGAQLVVNSARFLGSLFLSEEIVALTVVAFGTSLPELVTSVSAARKGDVGIATGNIIGSNIANVLLIGGLGIVCTGAAGLPFSTEGLISGLVSIGAAVLLFSSCWGQTKSIGKTAGAVMLVCLVCYYGVVLANALYFHWY